MPEETQSPDEIYMRVAEPPAKADAPPSNGQQRADSQELQSLIEEYTRLIRQHAASLSAQGRLGEQVGMSADLGLVDVEGLRELLKGKSVADALQIVREKTNLLTQAIEQDEVKKIE